MDTALAVRFIGMFLFTLLLIFLIRGRDINNLEPWDGIVAFFSGPFAPVSFPFIIIYLGVIYAHRKAR